ncbi:protein GAMETE EXPRESSED 1 isoform X1 [Lactuca sativa]|uniref:protein GAMETE EXPRESSED 1 isoform X1 n=2 Tax=Lactuca sativa TaxID=4236 RepID=UPI000CD8CFB0|nr:protein GAMETE EXPRESSED 1 isoform X1 [Lactuca sativa]
MNNSHKNYKFGFLWVLMLLSHSIYSFSWLFSTRKVDSNEKPSSFHDVSLSHAEFSMESLSSKKGMSLVEKAKRKVAMPNSCWQNAYGNLFAGCSEILADEEQRSRLAWHLSDCFQKDTGRPPFPYCHVKDPMVNCLKNLDKAAHTIYLEFYLETNSICHQLQTDAFKRQTERLVNELKKSAEYAEEKLEKIENQAEGLLHTSDHVQESLSSIDVQTQQVSQTSKNIQEHVSVVLQYSQSVYNQSLKLLDSQMELRNGQMKMNERLDEGMIMLNESTSKIGEEMKNLRNEAVEIEKEIGKVGDAMFMKMNRLQGKADDIENIAETSLDKQKQLIDSQTAALEILHTVTSFQSQALEESRGTLQQLIELGQSQQQELIQRQQQLKAAHDDLVKNSKSILAAQETFESKQASMFLAIEKLFDLHNAILLESRVIKSFLVYSILIFTLYMFTSTKQTYNVRSRLYIGLCVTFLIEFMVLRYGNEIEQQAWIISIVRLIFVFLASCQLLYAIYTFSRDYETLNHQMLQSLIEKVNGMQGNKQSLCDDDDDDDDDDDVDWSSWVDTDLPEDESEDLDYKLPEEVGEASITNLVSRQYTLRHRHL